MAVTINIPSQVKTYANLAAFPASGSLKTIYIAEDTNKTYRWTGSVYVEISASAAMTWGQIGGTLSNQTDLQNALDAKVPTSRTLTINGTTQDLSANRTFNIPTDLTVGTTPISSGTIGRVLFQGTGNVLQQSSSLFWDSTNNRLGIGTSTPEYPLDILGNLSGFNIGFKLRNSASTGYTEIMCFNNGGTLADRMYMGVGGTTTGDAFQNRGYFVASNNLEGVNFTATKPTTGDIRFFTGGVNERLRIHGNGNIGINTTTDAGFRLDVNGTARVVGPTFAVGDWTQRSTSVYVRALAGGSENRGFYIGSGASNDGNVGSMTWSATTGLLMFRSPYNSGTIALSLEGNTNSIQFHNQSGTAISKFFSNTGNWGINTTTDAGFRLDVNGTARVSTSLATPIWAWSGTNVSQRIQTTQVGSVNRALINIENGQGGLNYSTDGFVNSILAINNSLVLQNQGMASCFTINPTYNFNANVTSGAIMRGIYYNPTLTNIGTATHYAFHSTSGRVRFENLPTSATGLNTGELWNDGGTLKIV